MCWIIKIIRIRIALFVCIWRWSLSCWFVGASFDKVCFLDSTVDSNICRNDAVCLPHLPSSSPSSVKYNYDFKWSEEKNNQSFTSTHNFKWQLESRNKRITSTLLPSNVFLSLGLVLRRERSMLRWDVLLVRSFGI